MKKLVIVAFAALLAGMAAYRGYKMQMSKKETGNARERKIPVIVGSVQKGEIEQVLTFTGDIKGKEEVDVMPRVPGKLIEYKVREGDRVKKDQVIALIDRDVVGLNFKPSEVNSPIDGIVVKIYLDRGAGVNPATMSQSMGTPVARVVDSSSVRAIIRVPERDYPSVKKGQIARIKVDAFKDRVFAGKVSSISPMIDSASRTSTVEIEMENADGMLKSGMFARINLVTDKKSNALLATHEAVMESGNSLFVYTAKNGVSKKVEITAGISDGKTIEVLSGLSEGDKIVKVGQEMLFDGANIEIVEGKAESK